MSVKLCNLLKKANQVFYKIEISLDQVTQESAKSQIQKLQKSISKEN